MSSRFSFIFSENTLQLDLESQKKLKQLASYTLHNETPKIENWFKINQFNTTELENLIKAINSNDFYNNLYLKYIDKAEELYQIHKVLLPFFSLKNQLLLMDCSSLFYMKNTDLFEIIYQTAQKSNSLNTLYESNLLSTFTSFLFIKNALSQIKNLEKNIDYSFEKIKIQHALILSEYEKENDVMYWLKLNKPCSIVNLIALNFNDETKEFFKTKKIPLLHQNEIENFQLILQSSLLNECNSFLYKKIEIEDLIYKKIKRCSTFTLFDNLNKTIKHNPLSVKNIVKI